MLTIWWSSFVSCFGEKHLLNEYISHTKLLCDFRRCGIWYFHSPFVSFWSLKTLFNTEQPKTTRSRLQFVCVYLCQQTYLACVQLIWHSVHRYYKYYIVNKQCFKSDYGTALKALQDVVIKSNLDVHPLLFFIMLIFITDLSQMTNRLQHDGTTGNTEHFSTHKLAVVSGSVFMGFIKPIFLLFPDCVH